MKRTGYLLVRDNAAPPARPPPDLIPWSHGERNHQGLDNELIAGTPARDAAGHVSRRSRLGGLLNYYERAA